MELGIKTRLSVSCTTLRNLHRTCSKFCKLAQTHFLSNCSRFVAHWKSQIPLQLMLCILEAYDNIGSQKRCQSYKRGIIQMSHWHCKMVVGGEFGISFQQLPFLSSFSSWQLIQKSTPSSTLMFQHDIRIHNIFSFFCESQIYEINPSKFKHPASIPMGNAISAGIISTNSSSISLTIWYQILLEQSSIVLPL